MRMSLKKRILLLVAATVLSLFAVLLYCLGNVASDEIDRAVQSKVRSAANLLAQLLNARSSSLTDRCQALIKGAVPPRSSGMYAASHFARRALRSLKADALMITDSKGRLLGDSSYVRSDGTVLTPKRVDYGSHPSVRAGMHGKSWQGVVARGSNLFLAVGMPVIRGGSTSLVMTAFIRLDNVLARQMKQALLTDVAFVNGDKVVASTLARNIKGLTKPRSTREYNIGKRSLYSAYAALPGTTRSEGMGMIALDEEDDALNPFRNLNVALVLAASSALAVSLLLGLWVGRSFSVPLQRVIDAAKELKKGEWPEPLKVARLDEVGQLQVAFNDMTLAIRRSHDRLLAMVDADPLTGLENHRKFQERLEEEVTRTAFSKQPLSILIVDIDKFQEYNQTHGHAEGDTSLTRTGKLIRHASPDKAIIARFGGEEFAVLLPDTALDEAEQIAEKIRSAVHNGTATDGRRNGVTVSIGCAQLLDSREDKGFVLTAELAVSRAKQLGRNRVCRFDSMPGFDESFDPHKLSRFLQDGSFATIQALAAAVDAKDPYTQGHSQRVAEYARDLAKFAGYPEDIVSLVFRSGTLHDVGKVGVPDNILKKTGKLTDEERAVMETHPVLGELIIKKAPHLSDTLPGVRHHHERWDGRGYPDGLSGEDIPLLGRILAVADVFDAMTSDRPYRKGLHFWEAIWEIERNAGSQFEPKLALAFVQMMRQKCEWSNGTSATSTRRRSRKADWEGPEKRRAG